MGRLRDDRVSIRLSIDERKRWERACERWCRVRGVERLPLSSWVRTLVWLEASAQEREAKNE